MCKIIVQKLYSYCLLFCCYLSIQFLVDISLLFWCEWCVAHIICYQSVFNQSQLSILQGNLACSCNSLNIMVNSEKVLLESMFWPAGLPCKHY